MERIHRHKALIRFLVLYSAFSLILLVMIIPIYRYIYHMSEKNAIDRCSRRLQNGIYNFDTTISAMKNVVLTTNQDTQFQKLKYESAEVAINPLMFPQLRQMFNSLIIPHTQITDAGILFTDLIVLTRQRTFYSADYYDFYGQFLKCDMLSYQQWKNDLDHSQSGFIPETTYWSSDYGSYKAITYVQKWANLPKHSSVFFAMLPREKLLSSFADKDILNSGYLRITDQNELVLLEKNDSNIGSYFRISEKSIFGITVEIGIPASIVRAELQPIIMLMYVFSAAIILFAVLLVIFFSYRSSAPMRNLMKTIQKLQYIRFEKNRTTLIKRSFFRNFISDYDELELGLCDMDKRIETYQHTILHQRELIKSQLLEKAMQQGLYSQNEYNTFSELFPDFPSCFCLALFYYDIQCPIVLDKVVAIQIQILDSIKKDFPEILVSSRSNNSIVMLFPITNFYENETHKLSLSLQIQDLRKKLIHLYNLPFTYAMSDVYSRPQDLTIAYRQIQHIDSIEQDNLFTWIYNFKNADTCKDQLPISFANLQTIYNALSMGNQEVALSVLNDCLKVLQLREDKVMLGRHIFSMLVNIFVQLKLENPDKLSKVNIPIYNDDNKHNVLYQEIPSVIKMICDQFISAQDNTLNYVAQTILDYINDNLFNPDLYVNMVAEHFTISAPTLQKLVKKSTGQTFFSYVEEQRLLKAYNMLSQTNESISDVSNKCGYYNTNSFYKAFKRKYGISPSSIIRNEFFSQQRINTMDKQID